MISEKSVSTAKQEKRFSNLNLARINRIEKLHNSADFSNLKYQCKDLYKNSNLTYWRTNYFGWDKVKQNKNSLHRKKPNGFWLKFEWYKYKRSNEQKSQIENNASLSDVREEVIKFYKHYFTMIFTARYDAAHGKGLKIILPKQMLPRLPTAHGQVKASNTSENLLNKILEIIYSLYQAKCITI